MKEKTILPPTFFVTSAIVSIVFHLVLPVVILVHYPLNLAGIAFIVFGGMLNIWADQLFKKYSTTVKPYEKASVLVVEGPFRWCRHPMYLGMAAILVGISLICGSVTSFIGPIAFWLIIRIRFMPADESAMLNAFGDEYKHYRRRVRSWM